MKRLITTLALVATLFTTHSWAQPVCNASFVYYPATSNVDSIHFYPTGGSTTGAQYYWNFGDGDTSTAQTPWHYYASAGIYYACLYVKDSTSSGTCDDRKCDSVSVNMPPVCNAQFTFAPNTHNADSVYFTASSNAASSHYLWTFGDGTSSSTTNPWHYYTTSGSFYVCLIVTDSTSSGNCRETSCDSVHITAPPPPTCNATFQFYPLTNNSDSIHFYPATNPTGSHYYWYFGDTDTSTTQAPVHYYASAGAYYVCLVVRDSTPNGTCHQQWCDSIHVGPPPPPTCNSAFSFYLASSNSDSVHFYPSYTNATSTTYSWSFGDGNTSTNQDPWHYYASSGTYNVCLTVTDSTSSGRCTQTTCDSVHVTAPPPPPPPVCNAHYYHYSSTSNQDSVHFYPPTNPTNSHYYWSFGDGTTSTNMDPWHLFPSAGSYYTCLVVTDTTSAGTCRDYYCDSITVGSPPPPPPVCNAYYTYYFLTHNPDSLHVYPPTSNPANAHYYWNFGDGDTSTALAPWHMYATTGTYYVCLTVTDSSSSGTCTQTHCDSIVVTATPPPPPPVCNANFQFYPLTSNLDSVHFYPATNPPGTNYYWNFGDGDTSSAQSPWHLYATTGTYYVCLVVRDSSSSGTCHETWCDSVKVNTPPPPPPPVCNANFQFYSASTNSDSLHFYPATNVSGTQYYWSFGDGTYSTNQDPWHLFPSAGSYYVCLIVSDSTSAGSCRTSHCDSIHVGPPPPPVCNAVIYHYSLTTNPDSVHFYPGTNPTGTTYSWSFGDGTYSTNQDPWHFYTSAGIYTICLTVSDSTSSGTCHTTQCDTVHVNVTPPPTCNAQFGFYNATHNLDSLHFYLSNTPAAGTQFHWSFGDGDSSSYQDPWHLYTTTGAYYVCLTVWDSTSSGNCRDSYCDSVHVNPPPPAPTCDAHFSHYSTTNLDSVHFYPATNASGSQYLWMFGDGTYSQIQDPWHNYTYGGTFTVCLNVTDSNASGQCHDTWCDTVGVPNPMPRPYVDPSVYYMPVNENDAAKLESQQPSPVVNVFYRDHITISLQNLLKPVTVRFFDGVGRQIFRMDNLVDGTYNVPDINIRSGLYYYDVNDDSQLVSKGKLMVIQ